MNRRLGNALTVAATAVIMFGGYTAGRRYIPTEVWFASKKPDPYAVWTGLAVEMGSFADANGCRRARLQQHDQRFASRWVMYYSVVPDFRTAEAADSRFWAFDHAPTTFVVKLYADRTAMPLGTSVPAERVEHSAWLLSDELLWLLRPCDGDKVSKFYESVYPKGVPMPLHLVGAE